MWQLLHAIYLNSASPLLARVCAVADAAGTLTDADHAAEVDGAIRFHRVRDERSLPKRKRSMCTSSVHIDLYGDLIEVAKDVTPARRE